MNSYLLVFKRKAIHLTATLIIFVWAIIATIYALQDKKELILVGIDENGTRIIGTNNDPLFKSEVVAFLKQYADSLYNFTPMSFNQNVGAAVEFMSPELWIKEEKKYKELQEMVKREDVNLNGEVFRIIKNQDDTYLIEIDIVEKTKILTKKRKLFTTIKLQQVDRDENNIWGLEVVSHDEKYTSI